MLSFLHKIKIYYSWECHPMGSQTLNVKYKVGNTDPEARIWNVTEDSKVFQDHQNYFKSHPDKIEIIQWLFFLIEKWFCKIAPRKKENAWNQNESENLLNLFEIIYKIINTTQFSIIQDFTALWEINSKDMAAILEWLLILCYLNILIAQRAIKTLAILKIITCFHYQLLN